ncbi:MAG: response regulator [Spirochaetaceae bacterium]|nr:response regulator [Spirochaetaceae bacterium]
MKKRTIPFFLYTFFSILLLFAEKQYQISLPPDTSISTTRIIQEAFSRCQMDSFFSLNEPRIGLIYTETNRTDGIVLIENAALDSNLPFARVDEPIIDISLSVVSTDKSQSVSNWKDLKNKTVGFVASNDYIRRMLESDKTIKALAITSKQELFNVLRNGLIDYGIIYTHDSELRLPLPEDIFEIGSCAKLLTYLYLNPEFKAEAGFLSRALTNMKSDGTYKKIVNNLSNQDSPKNILFITSAQKDQKLNEKLDNLIEEYCSNNQGISYETFYLKSRTNTVDYANLNPEITAQIHNKFSKYAPSIIITRGLETAQFVSDNYESLFKGTPVIITGIPYNYPVTFNQIGTNSITVQETISTKETVETVLELFPKTKNIFILNDKTKTGFFWQEQMVSDISKNFPNLSIRTNQNVPDSSLPQILSLLTKGTVVLTGSIDAYQDSFDMLELTNVPIFGLDYTSSFEYEIGGKYSSIEQHFSKVLNIVDNTLKGVPLPATAALVENPQKNRWIYNYKNLNRFLSFPLLKMQVRNAEIQNKPLPFYKTYLFLVFSIIFFILLVITGIVLLIMANLKIHKLKNEKAEDKKTSSRAQVMQQMVYETSNQLSTADLNNNFSNQLAGVLEPAAKAAGMDKAYIWKVSVTDQTTQPQCTLLAKWEQSQSTQNLPLGITMNIDTFFTDWGIICKSPRPIYMTQSHATGLVRYQMAQSSVTTRLLLPILSGNSIWGFSIFDNSLQEVKPDRNTVEALTAFTQIVSFREIEHNANKFMKEAQEAAISGTNAKSTFLANMSHEIRTPLNAILGMSDLILLDKNLSPHIYEYTQNINSSSRNLLGIINDILDFSKIESGKLELVPATYDFESLINDVISMVRIKAHNTFLSLFIRIAPDIPRKLIGDELRIKQILLNLFTNAIKYTKEGSVTLTISDVISDDTVEFIFEMQDTGIGIKPEEQTKLFNMFERLDTKRNRDIEGTGLGLAITKQLCELMGGSIDFASEYGNGSTFTAQIKQRIGDSTPLVDIEKVQKKKVLIYEPRRRHRRFLTVQLTDIGINPAACSNLTELSEILSKHKTFDYIFVSRLYLSRIRSHLKTMNKKFQLVVLADSEYEFANMEDVIVLQVPLYCVQLANFFSNKSYKYQAQKPEYNPNNIFAPDAKVLVVDDNVVNLKVASGLLATHGIIPVTATSGFDALTALHQQKFDLVFMDHLMPEMDGIETTQAIRKLQNDNRNVIIVALTANAMTNMKEQFIKEGMNDFLAKPIEKDKFNEILAQWLPESTITYRQAEKTENETVLQIQGVDTVAGMNCAGNSLPTYIDILETYAKDAANKIELLKTALAENDLHNFTVHVHALKSASRSIGATFAGNLAEKLEKAGAEGKRAFIDENAETCFETVSEIIENIKKFLDSRDKNPQLASAQKEEGTPESFRETLLSIKQEAENFNILAIQANIDTLRNFSWKPEQQAAIDRLFHASESYDYDSIIEIADGLLS